MAIALPLRPTTQQPKAYWLSQPYHTTPLPGLPAPHLALDMVGYHRQPVYAVESGKVFASSWDGGGWAIGGGNAIVIDHFGPANLRAKSVYAHLYSRAVSTGQYVLRGQLIGYADSTGLATGNHVHFAVAEAHGDPRFYASYVWLDPYLYLKAHTFANGSRGNGARIRSPYFFNTVKVKPGNNVRSGPSLSAGILRTTTKTETFCYIKTVTGGSWRGSRGWDYLWHPQIGFCYVHTLIGEWVV